MKLLVTGASGFVGNRVLRLAAERGLICLAHCSENSVLTDNNIIRKNLGPTADWLAELHGVDVVIHCAARVHQLQDIAGDYITPNVEGTIRLAQQAASAGAKRFVFLSSVKVNGEASAVGEPFVPDVSQIPDDPYAKSKYDAEEALWRIASDSGMEVVVIRSPLVYGPGVKANFLSLMHAVYRGYPLPLASVRHNRRSMVYVDNLADLLLCAAQHPQAAGELFMVSDNHDVSTAALLSDLAAALGVRSRLWRFPPAGLKTVALLTGKQAVADRLLGSLQVDISKTQRLLGWYPYVEYQQGLRLTAEAWLVAENKE